MGCLRFALISALLGVLVNAQGTTGVARVGRLVFIDADSDQVIPTNQTKFYGKNVLDYGRVGTDSINIMLYTSKATKSVKISIDEPPVSFCESRRPFALFANSIDGATGVMSFQGKRLPFGRRTLTAVPYLGDICEPGTEGDTFVRNIEVLRPGQEIPFKPREPPATTTTTTKSTTTVSTAPETTTATTATPETTTPETTSTTTTTPETTTPETTSTTTTTPEATTPETTTTGATTPEPTMSSTTTSSENPTTSEEPDSGSLQPRIVTVESYPARKVAGVVDLPEGSPWCNGKPTYWLPGHKYEDDTPNCYDVGGGWTRPSRAVLDVQDTVNDVDGPEVIDRHDCAALDIDNDGNLDLYCLVGANKGEGEGYNEVYLTQPDGSLQKVLRNGLQKHNGLRGRRTAVLQGPGNEQFVFIVTKGGPRSDGKSNMHHMYRKTGLAPDYFEEVEGPFNKYSDANCAYKTDVNGDGLDDVILCGRKKQGVAFLQQADGSWSELLWDENNRQRNWRSVRVGDFNNDGLGDLVVAYWGDTAKLRIFPGMREHPYFDFNDRYFEADLQYAAPDIEVLDVNGDGIMDLYVVQSDEESVRSETGLRQVKYCAGKFYHSMWWERGNQPPKDFVPPVDVAQDMLFVGRGATEQRRNRFAKIAMDHAEPGCGNLVRPFGEKKLLLAQGDFTRPGHNLVLEWQ